MQSKYGSWGLYNDANDPRLLVPKRNPAMGWTINVGHRSGRIALIAIVVVLAAVIAGSALLG